MLLAQCFQYSAFCILLFAQCNSTASLASLHVYSPKISKANGEKSRNVSPVSARFPISDFRFLNTTFKPAILGIILKLGLLVCRRETFASLAPGSCYTLSLACTLVYRGSAHSANNMQLLLQIITLFQLFED